MGFGFRGSSPPWPYVGRGRGGLPRCFYPGAFVAPPYTVGSVPYPFFGGVPMGTAPGAPTATPFAPQVTREEELGFLKSQAEAIKGQLEQIESRVRELESQAES